MSNNLPLQLSLFPDQNFATPKKKQKAKNNSIESYLEQQKAELSDSWQQPQEFEVSVADQIVQVSFEPWIYSYHFQFHGLMVSPTGYRSHFVQLETAKLWDSPIIYAEQKAQDLHKELLKSRQRHRRKTEKTVAKSK